MQIFFLKEIEAQPDKKHNLQTILNELDEIILMPLKPCELPNENNFYRSCAIFGKRGFLSFY